MTRKKGKSERTLHSRLRQHLGADPSTLAVVEKSFQLYHRPNVQIAIDNALRQQRVTHDLYGIIMRHNFDDVSLAKLSRRDTDKGYPPGPVEYRDVEMADGKSLACVKRGIYFINAKGVPLVLLVNEGRQVFQPQLTVEVMSREREVAQDFSRELNIATRRAPAFRGKVISLEMETHNSILVRFHRLPKIARDQIILPAAVLDRIDRHAGGFVKHADRLRAAGRHLKRGVLLHGPPGTGKTLSAMYLAGQMPGRTVMILTGAALSSVQSSGAMARALAPVTIILEDVDLIGTVREQQSVGANALLFELLNQMDGLAEDADVLYVLTTNRPELLEPALAARPGRIDQAIEIPLPDAECRRRLLELYARGLKIEPDAAADDWRDMVNRTEGVSAAFIRELLRKAAVLAASGDGAGAGDGNGLIVRMSDLNRAIDELLINGGQMTRRILGFAAAAPKSGK